MSVREVAPLPADIQVLIDEERSLTPMPSAGRLRVAARLTHAASVGASSSRWLPRLPALRRVGLACGLLVVGAGVGATVEGWRAPPKGANLVVVMTPPLVMTVERPEASVTAPAPPVVDIGSLPSARPAAASAAPAERATRSPVASSLASERAMLETARVAMTRGRWNEATAALDRHLATFSSAQLAEERESLRVVLLAEEGRPVDARAAESRFRRTYPQSFFLGAVRAAIDSMTDVADAGQVTSEHPGTVKDGDR